jgi:hypothetical protein
VIFTFPNFLSANSSTSSRPGSALSIPVHVAPRDNHITSGEKPTAAR